MKTLTQRALDIATRKQETAWQKACKCKLEGAKKHWINENNRLAVLVIKLTYRLNGE